MGLGLPCIPDRHADIECAPADGKKWARPALARWSYYAVYLMFHMARLSVSESSVDPSFDQIQVAPPPAGILKYPDRQTDDLLRLSTVERKSTCVRALVIVRDVLAVPYGAAFSI